MPRERCHDRNTEKPKATPTRIATEMDATMIAARVMEAIEEVQVKPMREKLEQQSRMIEEQRQVIDTYHQILTQMQQPLPTRPQLEQQQHRLESDTILTQQQYHHLESEAIPTQKQFHYLKSSAMSTQQQYQYLESDDRSTQQQHPYRLPDQTDSPFRPLQKEPIATYETPSEREPNQRTGQGPRRKPLPSQQQMWKEVRQQKRPLRDERVPEPQSRQQQTQPTGGTETIVVTQTRY